MWTLHLAAAYLGLIAMLAAVAGCGDVAVEGETAPSHFNASQMPDAGLSTVVVAGLDLLQSATELTLTDGRLLGKVPDGNLLEVLDGKFSSVASGEAVALGGAELRRQVDGSAWLIKLDSVEQFQPGYSERKSLSDAPGAVFSALGSDLRVLTTAPEFALGIVGGELVLVTVTAGAPLAQKLPFDAVTLGEPVAAFRGADRFYVLTKTQIAGIDPASGVVGAVKHGWEGILASARLVGVSGSGFAGDLSMVGLAVVDAVGLHVTSSLVAGLGAQKTPAPLPKEVKAKGKKQAAPAGKKATPSPTETQKEEAEETLPLPLPVPLPLPPADLFAGLTLSDIGSPATPGLVTRQSASLLALSVSGRDVYGATDQCSFLYKTISGDATVVVRVDSMTDTNDWAKAGIMFRASLAANASHAAIAATPALRTIFQIRASDGATITAPVAYGAGVAGQWLKLVRRGDEFSAFQSSDGVAWTQQGTTQTIVGAPDDMLVGYFGVSHAERDVMSVEFSQASFAP